MKLAIRIALVIATCLGFVVLVPGCGNQNTASTPPQSAGCTSDAQCNGLKCASGECVQCTADSDFGKLVSQRFAKLCRPQRSRL